MDRKVLTLKSHKNRTRSSCACECMVECWRISTKMCKSRRDGSTEWIRGATMAAVQLRMTSATHGRWESEEGTWERIKYCLKTSENRCGTPTCCLAESWDASLKLCDALVLRMLAAQANLGFLKKILQVHISHCSEMYYFLFFIF